MQAFRRLLTIAVCLFSGCVSIAPSPDDMGDRVSNNTNLCASIDGTYHIHGTGYEHGNASTTDDNGQKWRLTTYLLSPDMDKRLSHYAPTSVHVGHMMLNEKNYLTIQVLSNDKVIHKSTLGNKSFECTDEGIKLESVTDTGAVFIGGYHSGIDVLFSRNGDGDLVMKYNETGLGVAGMILPFPVFIESYAKWPAVTVQ